MTIQKQLQKQVESALNAAQIPLEGIAPESLAVVPATNPQFGDYQWNGALPLAKVLRQKPRDIAQKVLEHLDVSAISETPEIAGAGFLNFRLKTEFLADQAAQMVTDERLGIEKTSEPLRVVVDFSSPNVAKPMHVGHIRSTIIGDAIQRTLRFAGHNVITDNHIGDWGTAFGKIIIGWKDELDEAALRDDPLGEMERIYKLINERAKNDPELEERARQETALLQSGDATNRGIWESARELSRAQFDEIYGRLGINFDHELGESFYNPMLEGVVSQLQDAGIARESEGAIAVFSDGKGEPKSDPFLIFKDGEWRDTPAVIRKRDGAATYATTDMATLQFRVDEWKAQEILYVTDARQEGHFRQVFSIFDRWKGDLGVDLRHIAFGTILGDDKKPLKTRDGSNVKLRDLLNEAESRALAIVQEKNTSIDAEQAAHIARVVGISAIKYGDLSQNRATDYVFSWDKMLAMNGNSAVYLLYAYARTRSVRRKTQEQNIELVENAPLVLQEKSEIELTKRLLRFGEAIEAMQVDYRPNVITDYLYALAGDFAAFWRDCRIIEAPEEVRNSRLTLCRLSGDVLKCGLNLLGIDVLEQM